MRAIGAIVLAASLGGPSCGIEPILSDTGFTGTWSRGNDRNVSILAIVPRHGALRFRDFLQISQGDNSLQCPLRENRIASVLLLKHQLF